MIKKQKGMTLVEVLATLLISSLFIILIWTTVTISMKHNLIETKKLQMQLEANYIISDLQRIHRISKCYQIIKENEGWKSVECSSGNIISTYSNTEFKYDLSGFPEMIYTKQIEAKKAEKPYSPSYLLTVRVSNFDDKGPSLEISTTVSRFDERQ